MNDAPAPAKDPAASMALLTTVVRDADQQYRTGRPGAGTPGPLRRIALVATTLALGLLMVVAVQQWRLGSTVRSQERDALIERIGTSSAALDALAADVQGVSARVAQAERAAAERGRRGPALAAQLAEVEVAAARTPVAGPGVSVTVQDAEVDAVTGDVPEGGEVLDRDVQLVANGLWQAGAEAVAVNGHRLGATTAIRSAGQAILVELRPLVPPYVVSAVGDEQLAERFEHGPAAAQLRGLARDYGLRWMLERPGELTLPAASGARS